MTERSGARPAAFVVAEAGVNHNGSLDLARRLVDCAADAGADAVKFQTFRADRIASAGAPKAEYQLRTTDVTESQVEMLRRLELGEEEHRELARHCAARRIEFLSTPFDPGSVELLVRLGVRRLKIASPDISNAPLLHQAARTGLPIILSTGMSTLGEIELALGVLAFGYLGLDRPSRDSFLAAYGSPAGRVAVAGRVTLLHCTTEYPAPLAEVNLRVMDALRSAFELPVGYSDHTPGITVAVAAAARGATVVEKHVTLDRNLPGPDHQSSVEPGELAALVRAIREVELALGSAQKVVTPSEAKNRCVARKSLVAGRRIARGETFTAENLAVKRPGGGLSPYEYWEWLGRVAARDYEADEAIAP